jgi:hypothetical protein
MDFDFQELWISIPFEIRVVLLVLFGAILSGMVFMKDDDGKYFVHYIRSPYDEENEIGLRRSKRLMGKPKVNYK